MQHAQVQLFRKASERHKAGDLAEAARLYQEALRAAPGELPVLEAFGLLCFQSGKFADAERIYAEAMQRAPADATAAYNRGCALQQLKRDGEALHCFDRALAVKPDHLGALVNRAVLLQGLERDEDALASCDRALAMHGDFVPALVNRGHALLALGRAQEALSSYGRALALEPGAAGAEEGREVARFELGDAPRAPAAFLRRLYAKFSTYYEEQMLGWLGYCGHTELRRLADKLQPVLQAPLRIWDLGCGTGLAGEAFKDLAASGRLDGVDLSPPMLAVAEKRGLYTSLILADLEVALAESSSIYDLVLFADTLIYFGDLVPVLRGVARLLPPEGLLLFTVESADGTGWRFGVNRRFQHSREHIISASAVAGFSVAAWADFTLRTENAAPVPAFAVALRRMAAGRA